MVSPSSTEPGPRKFSRGRFRRNRASGAPARPRASRTPHTLHYAAADNRIDIVRDGGATSSLWWATKNEWLGLIDVAGLELEALHGGFTKEPLTDDSTEYVFVTRRH